MSSASQNPEVVVGGAGTVDRGVELVGLTRDDDGVQLSLRRADGSEETVVTSWVVGADGARSAVRHLLDTKLEGSFKGERFILGDCDAEHDLDEKSMYTM